MEILAFAGDAMITQETEEDLQETIHQMYKIGEGYNINISTAKKCPAEENIHFKVK